MRQNLIHTALLVGLALGLAWAWSPATQAQRGANDATYAYSFQVHRDGEPFTGVLDVFVLSPTEGCHEDVPVYGGQARVDIPLGDLDGSSFAQESYRIQLALRQGDAGRCEDEEDDQTAFYNSFTALDPDYVDNLRAYRNNGDAQSYHPVPASYWSATSSSLDIDGDLEAEQMILGDPEAATNARFATLQVGSLTRVSLREGGQLTVASGDQGGLAWGSSGQPSARWSEDSGSATLQADAGRTQGLRLRYDGATLGTLGTSSTSLTSLTVEDDLDVDGALSVQNKEANGVLFELEPVYSATRSESGLPYGTRNLGLTNRRACFLTGTDFEADDYLDACYIRVVDGQWQLQAYRGQGTTPNGTLRDTTCYARCLTW